MRSTVRGALAIVVAIAGVVGVTTTADADKDKTVPTQQQVDQAKAAVTSKAGDVAAIRADLVLARNTLEAAAEKAEVAAEAFNGAQWRLGEAKVATAQAVAAAAAATQKVASERAGLAALANESFQHGSSLNGLTAFFADGGPEDVMAEVEVARSASDSIQYRYEQFKALDVLARTARERAEKAQDAQAALVREAAHLRDVAAAAAESAQSQAASVAARRRQLIGELAAAQQISVRLALQRQDGLERIAEAKAAAAAAAKARAEAAAKARQESADHAANGGSSGSSSGGSSGSGGGTSTPAGTTGSAARAIAFARDQLGEPYVWAAAGPGSWDCSGLTMMAWHAGGVSLPHYSAAQYAATQHIGVTDLRPGDLVFWGDSPGSIHHVALYIGNGQILHAPRTGRPVEIDSMYYWVPPNYFGRP